MNTHNDGGPAFPTKHPALDPRACGVTTEPGMTLRDWFAGKALQGMLADPERRGSYGEFAKHAYAFADAMLAERSRHE